MFLLLIFQKISGLTPPDWLLIITALFFVGSIQLIGIGVLGLYVQSVYIATKNRPNYIIESVFGFSEEELEHIRKKPTGNKLLKINRLGQGLTRNFFIGIPVAH